MSFVFNLISKSNNMCQVLFEVSEQYIHLFFLSSEQPCTEGYNSIISVLEKKSGA